MIHNGKRYGTGACPSAPDARDYSYHEIAHGSAPFDWSKGFDIETKISLPSKDQGQSSSCGGQAWAYYDAVIEFLSTGTYEERSARFIYSQTFVPGGGSAGRTNSALIKDRGDARESVFTSYQNGNPPSEAFMQNHSDITQVVLTDAATGRALSYTPVPTDINTVAQAIRDNGGVVLGVAGSNNGTWLSNNPKKPKPGEEIWRHWLYAGKARLFNGVKQIGVKNSWGDEAGDKGWQWLDAEYFDGNIWEAWSMIFNSDGLPVGFHHTFKTDLSQGMTSTEVNALQTALQLDGCFPASIKPTQFFGVTTLASVKKFQDKYNVAHYGDAGYGRVGPKTRAQLNSIFA